MSNGFVVHVVENLRDGREEFAKCFKTKEDALKWIEELSSSFFGRGYHYYMFELGNQVKLVMKEDVVEVAVETKKVKKYYVEE